MQKTEKRRKLTDKQTLIYDLYFNQRIKQKDIASSLQISQQAVSKTIKKIKKKTDVPEIITGGCIKQGMVRQKGLYKNWRVEALNFNVKPYYFYPRYQKTRLEIGNYSIPHKRWRIFLHKDLVRVQLKEGAFFRDPDKDKAIAMAQDDFNKFLFYAANKYGFEYQKDGRVSISCNNMELEKEGSKFAEGYIKKTGENVLNVRDVNGKICFFIDRSKSDEHGYKGKDSYSHSENLEPYIADLLYNQPLTNSQITSRISDIVEALDKVVKVVIKEK